MTADKPKVDLKLTKGCCSEGIQLKGQIGPFNRAISLEHSEDRPLVGVVRCATCGNCFKFARLECGDAIAVYSFSPMPQNSLSLLEQGFSRLSKPSWPIWVPPTDNQMKEKERIVYDQLEASVLGRAGEPTLVYATKHLINGRVLGADRYQDAIINWQSRLGVK